MTELTKTCPGDLHVANKVLSDMAGYAALECYGVVGMANPDLKDGIIKILPRDRLRRGVVLGNTEEGITFDLYIVIEQGTSLNAVSDNLESRIRYVMSEYAQVPVASVTIHVQGVHVHD